MGYMFWGSLAGASGELRAGCVRAAGVGRAVIVGRSVVVVHRASGWLIVSVLAGSLGLAACGTSTSPRPDAAKAVKPPGVATTTTVATATKTPAISTTAINLSGTPGVTPAEQTRAEKLVEETIVDIRRFETPAEAYAAGYRSIDDGVTGVEHYVNWSYVNDGHILDPMRPESVVYERRNGAWRVVADMYMLPFGSTFADVPDVGGPLTQWHVHADLCLTNNPQQRVLSSITSVNGACPAGSTKAADTPMLHVWVVPNPCGPFAALEGIGAGQVPAGQTRLCDTHHASVP